MFAKTPHLSLILLVVTFLSIVYSFNVSAQTSQSTPSVFDYLTPQEGADISLELDLTELINNKKTNQYFPGSLSAGDGKMFGVEVRPRGKSRRRICDVPPLKLKFRKKELRAAGLDTLNEIKLVVPCFNDPESEALVMREYIAYRMFERINPAYSVRARLVKITFRDKHIEQTKAPVYGLLVEHEEQVAARLDGDIVEYFNLPADSIHTGQAALNAMFQYMIGNTDWGLSDIRNVYYLKPHDGSKIRVVPFDFDFSGLVNAPYAIPNSRTGLKNVRDRQLLADEIPNAALLQAAQILKNTQNTLLELCQASFLPEKSRGDMESYIKKFFEALGDKGKIPQRIKADLR